MNHPDPRTEAPHDTQILRNMDPNFIYVGQPASGRQVGIVSGCGALHEPMMSGYVGPGMLSAACAGPGVAPPSVAQIVAASRAVAGAEGVLHIVPHFAGEVEAFQSAADRLRQGGYRVCDVVIDDDTALRDPRHSYGRRALGVLLIAVQVCGAAAAQGHNLHHVTSLCRQVNRNGRSIAAAPAGPGRFEIGIGLTGEPGPQTLPFEGQRQLARYLTERLLTDPPLLRTTTEWDQEHWRWHEVSQRDNGLAEGERTILLASTLGQATPFDLRAITAEAVETAQRHGIKVERGVQGQLMTAPHNEGMSMSLVRIDDAIL